MMFAGTVAIETIRSDSGVFLDLGAAVNLTVPIPLLDENGSQIGLIDKLERYESRVVCSGTGDWGIARVYARARRTFCAPLLAEIISPAATPNEIQSCRVVAVHLTREPVWEQVAIVWFDNPESLTNT